MESAGKVCCEMRIGLKMSRKGRKGWLRVSPSTLIVRGHVWMSGSKPVVRMFNSLYGVFIQLPKIALASVVEAGVGVGASRGSRVS